VPGPGRDRQHVSRLCSGGIRVQGDHEADQLAPAYRNHHPRPRDDSVAQGLGNAVGVWVGEREREGDEREAIRHRRLTPSPGADGRVT